jgi:hypothetical protein
MLPHSLILAMLIFILFSSASVANSLEMDVKCAVYEDSDDQNDGNVDVRTYALGLKANSTYTAQVTPDHNPPTIVTAKTDQDGNFWAVAKIPDGERSLFFKVNLFDGNATVGKAVISGDDDAPCYLIRQIKK